MGSLPTWLRELLPIVILLAVVALVILRLPRIELGHTSAFRRRRLLNWLPLGLTYSFLYMGRYNLTVSKRAFEQMKDAAVGTVVYGCSFALNGPLTDRLGGRAAILAGAAGAALCNLALGAATYILQTHGAGFEWIRSNFTLTFSILYGANMYFQSFGAIAIVKCNAPWFHLRERGVFGSIFGILISLGIYFAFDWSQIILSTKQLGLVWVFTIPALLLGVFFVLDVLFGRNTPGEAGFQDFDTQDATEAGPRLGTIAVFKLMLRSPIIMTIACIEFCSGFLRQAIMQWYQTFAKQTDAVLHLKGSFVNTNWGMLLCCAGILGGVVAGILSDHFFNSRRGPVAGVLYLGMLLGSAALVGLYTTPAVGLLVIAMSVCVIGVHGMLSGTASMDFGGKQNVGVAVGIIDGFVYLGTGTMSLTYAFLLPKETFDASGKLTGAVTDPKNWIAWPMAMIPFALIGTALAIRLWNATPKRSAA